MRIVTLSTPEKPTEKLFQVIVELTGLVTYRIKAESAEEAEQIAEDRARDGMNLAQLDITETNIYDIADETNEL